MKLKIRILHSDDRVITQIERAPRRRKITNATVAIGARLRALDPTIEAIRVDGIDGYTWVGNFAAHPARLAIYDSF